MANLQIKLDDDLKNAAQKIANDLGMDLTTAVRIFLKQMVNDHSLPFRPHSDPFYSGKNQEALNFSLSQLQKEKIISKKLDDLLGMEK